MKQDPKKYTAPALEKGLDVIELLSAEEFGLSLSDIARSLSRSVGEIFRMLAVLQQRGYVALDSASNRYMLTTFVFELAHRLPNVRRLGSIAEPHMRALANDVTQSVHLGIISDMEVLVICQVDSPSYNVLSVRLGAKINLWDASSGRVIMAFTDSNETARLFREVALPKGASQKQLELELEKIRQDGHEVKKSFKVHGVVNISAPIFDHSGKAVAALTMPYIERIDEETGFDTCKQAVIKTAQELSQALGAGNKV